MLFDQTSLVVVRSAYKCRAYPARSRPACLAVARQRQQDTGSDLDHKLRWSAWRRRQKFLARVAARRIARDLCIRGRGALADVTSGGGLPLVQGWTPVRDEGHDRAFIAEIRWKEEKRVGDLRFGGDFGPRPGQGEDPTS